MGLVWVTTAKKKKDRQVRYGCAGGLVTERNWFRLVGEPSTVALVSDWRVDERRFCEFEGNRGPARK